MFGLKEKIASALTTGGIAVGLGAFAVLGIVWLSIALYTALTEFMAPSSAMAAVGALSLAPLVIWLLVRRKPERAAAPAPEPAPVFSDLPIERLIQSIDAISRTSPIGGVGLAFGAAWIASRTPNASALSSMLAAEAVERLLRLVAEYSTSHATADSAATREEPVGP